MQYLIKHKKVIILLILLVAGLIIYGNSFNNEFFWDDNDSIVNNIYIKDWQNFSKFFSENLIAGAGQTSNYWRPVLLISFALDYHIFGLNPFGFHLINTLLHIFVAWLVFIILHLLLKKNQKKLSDIFQEISKFYILPFLVSLFFLIHPLQTEAVSYIAGRADPLSSVFFLLAILFYLIYRLNKNKLIWQYGLALLFFIFGLFTKEQVILLPGIILLIEIILLTKKFNKESIIKILKLILPFVLISASYFLIRVFLLDFNDLLSGTEYQPDYDQNILFRFFTFTYVMILYFKLLFIPFSLQMAPEVPVITSFFTYSVLVFVIIFIDIIIISILTWRKNRFIAFGFLWFILILLPRINIISINRPMYEHWLYLPMIGFWLALFSLLALLFQYIKTKIPKQSILLVYLGLVIIIVYFFGFSILTIKRNNDWQNPISFYEKNLRNTPSSYIQHNNLGMAYAEAGREEEAINEYKKAIALKDIYPQVHYNLANSLKALNRFDEAIKEYEEALKISPNFLLAYNNLLSIYVEKSDQEKVGELINKMSIAYSRSSDFLLIAGAAYYNLTEYELAIKYWRELLENDPGNLAVRELVSKAKLLIKNNE
ncbi:MAG: tetratricopeptide repeat protein [Patescibacteria group bacterium]